jgi:hypothetical protein
LNTTDSEGNFGRIDFESGASQAIGGDQFNLKSAVVGTAIDFVGGKVGDRVAGYTGKSLGMTQNQGKIVGGVLSNTVTTPSNIISNEMT